MHFIAKKKAHNMLALMLDPKYKSMHLLTSYLGHEVIASSVIDYNEKIIVAFVVGSLQEFNAYQNLLY
jgi:hypothetical protein